MTTSSPAPKKSKLIPALLFVVLVACLVFLAIYAQKPSPQVHAISREGVVTQIQTMSQLTTSAFNIDTVITAQKTGTWQRLWQDEQKGLFIAKGRVLAGVDLSKITADDVDVHYPKGIDEPVKIMITLPNSQIFEVFLDDIQVYDWQTGLFGVVDNDPDILAQAQASAKAEVLKKACQGDILTLAKDNATEQIKGLFTLTGANVAVNMQAGACVSP